MSPGSRRGAAVAGLASLVWLGLAGLPWPARTLTALLLVVLPALTFAQMRALAAIGIEHLPRIHIYISSAITLWLLALVALIAAGASDFTAPILGLRALDLPVLLAWTLFGLAAAGMLYAFGRYFGLQETPLLLHLLPRTARERVAFVALSVTAGITEEFVFRGFLLTALAVSLDNALLAAFLSSAVFGLLHAYQGPIGGARAALLGFALAVPFLVSGSIVPSILAHAAIDIIGGTWLAGDNDTAHGLHFRQDGSEV